MAFVEKYYSRWKDHLQLTHEIKIYEDGGTGPAEGIPYVTPDPCTIRMRGSKDTLLKNVILGSELEFTFEIPSSMIAGIDRIFESNLREWKVEKYYNGVMEWVGYSQPDNYSRLFIKNGDLYQIRLTATDALAALKKVEYTNFSNGSQYNDRVSIIQTIKRALEHTGFNLDFSVQLNTWCTNDSLMNSNECALVEATVDNARYTIVQDGRELNEDCYTIIEKTLKDFNVHLFQTKSPTGPVYRIVNFQEKNSFNYAIPWSTLTPTRTANDLRVSLVGYQYMSRGESQKIVPFKNVELTFRDRNVADNILTNGDFSQGTAGWNKTGYFSGFNATGGFLRQPGVNWQQSGFDNPPTYIFTDPEAVTKIEDGDQMRVRFKYRCSSITPVGTQVVWMYARLFNAGTGSEITPVAQSPVTGNIPLVEGTAFQNYEAVFNMSGSPGTTNYELRIYTTGSVGGTAYTGFNFDIDDVVWNAVYVSGGDITFDRFYNITNIDDDLVGKFEDELFFGDSRQDSDIGSYQINDTRTKTWNRYTRSENSQIQEIYAKNILENYRKFKTYLRLNIIDPTYSIRPENILQIDSKDYEILGYDIQYSVGKEPRIICEVQECLNAAVNVSISSQDLTSVDGEGAGSGSSTPIGGGGEGGAEINDTIISSTTTWSSNKIDSEVRNTPTLDSVTDTGNTTTNTIQIGSLRLGSVQWHLRITGNNLEFVYGSTIVARLDTNGFLHLANDFEIFDTNL